MRVLLFTGKGGVGKTTTAAATACLAADRGAKVLVVSTDPAHSLSDALDHPLGEVPVEVRTGLYGMQVHAHAAAERSWRAIQGWLLDVLAAGGVDPIQAEELTVLPGVEEVLALLAVREQVAAGRFDLVVVDCAPTAETLRLLALPAALEFYLTRGWPVHRRVLRAVRPVVRAAGAEPGRLLPGEAVLAAVERLQADLRDVRALLVDPDVTSVRLVLTPERVVVAEARRTLTGLALHGYSVDEVVANRVLPTGGADAWRSGWTQSQAEQLAMVADSFAPRRVRTLSYAAAEPIGHDALLMLAGELYGDDDPAAPADPVELMTVRPDGDGFVLSLALPLADKREVDLARSGDELVVTVRGQRRLLTLPSGLRRCTVEGARLVDGRLLVDFVPDPALWWHR